MPRTSSAKQRRAAPKQSARRAGARKATTKSVVKKKAVKAKKAAVRATKASTPRVIAAEGRRIAARKQPAQTPVPARLTAADHTRILAEQLFVNPETYDTSGIIVDYHQLRQAGIRAMGGDIESASPSDLVQVEGVNVVKGSYATLAEGPAFAENIKKQKKGAGVVFRVHLLDFHVLTGEARINTRDFSAPDMVERVAEMTYDVANNGITDPAKATVRDSLLYGLGGETRWRAAVHAWIYKADGKLQTAPEVIPVILAPRGQNDADLFLNMVVDNAQKGLKTIEVAAAVKKASELGKPDEAIAKKLNHTVPWVRSMIAYMEMPEQLQNMVKSGEITVHVAWQAFEQQHHDPVKTMKAVDAARRLAGVTKSKRVMPRHLVATKTEEPRSSGKTPAVPVAVAAASPEPASTSSPSEARKSSTNKAEVALAKLIRHTDDVNKIIANAPMKDDGYGLYWYAFSAREIIDVLHPWCGLEIPESARTLDDEPKVKTETDVTDSAALLSENEASDDTSTGETETIDKAEDSETEAEAATG